MARSKISERLAWIRVTTLCDSKADIEVKNNDVVIAISSWGFRCVSDRCLQAQTECRCGSFKDRIFLQFHVPGQKVTD